MADRLASSRERPAVRGLVPPRQPTNEMLQAGYAALSRIYPPKENGGNAIGQQIVWEAMWDAAMTPRPGLFTLMRRWFGGGR